MQEGLEGKAGGFLRAERAMKPRKARRQLVAGLPGFLNCFLILRRLGNCGKVSYRFCGFYGGNEEDGFEGCDFFRVKIGYRKNEKSCRGS